MENYIEKIYVKAGIVLLSIIPALIILPIISPVSLVLTIAVYFKEINNADEAYLMIDPSVPQSLVFLRNVEKRARKYEAGVVIISHSVVDFLDPQIKMYGQALLDIPCFKIIMGTDGRNLHETKELYNLTDAEEELLASTKRGNALVIIGSKRLHVVFEIPEYKFQYMGKVGGR